MQLRKLALKAVKVVRPLCLRWTLVLLTTLNCLWTPLPPLPRLLPKVPVK
jgi:hypothetical protein